MGGESSHKGREGQVPRRAELEEVLRVNRVGRGGFVNVVPSILCPIYLPAYNADVWLKA